VQVGKSLVQLEFGLGKKPIHKLSTKLSRNQFAISSCKTLYWRLPEIFAEP
jgi:hypothetical protein